MYDHPGVLRMPQNNAVKWKRPTMELPQSIAATIKISPKSSQTLTDSPDQTGLLPVSVGLLIILLILLSLLNRSGGFLKILVKK